MPEQKRRSRANKDTARGDGAGVSEVVDRSEEQAEDLGGEAKAAGENAQDAPGAAEATTVTSELKNVVREAAIEVLSPVAPKATTSAAKYAVKKGPELLSGNVMPKVGDAVKGAGGPMELMKNSPVGGLVSKLGGGDGDAPSGTGRGRRLPIQESVDVAVPLDVAYNQFTQFEDFPEFMHRVERVEQKDDSHLMWHENIWSVRRQWEAEITDQEPDERIAREATSGSPKQKGVVTFHG